jgi:hypothetical protein
METHFREEVSFRLLDVVHPRPVDLLSELQTRLEGEVIGVTDDGRECARFLVIQVRGLSAPVLVPAGKASPRTPAATS